MGVITGVRYSTDGGTTYQNINGEVFLWTITDNGIHETGTGRMFMTLPPGQISATGISRGDNVIFDFTQSAQGRPFNNTDEPTTNLFTPVCFTADTMLLTNSGYKSCSELQVGDMIWTCDNGYQPVRWIGKRTVTAQEMAANENFRPVRISKGALPGQAGDRDLLVSRQHRMVISSKLAKQRFGQSEVLISAIKLTKLPGIYVDESETDVTYYHLMFDEHQIVNADGFLSESFFFGPEMKKNVMSDSQISEILAIFPDVLTATKYSISSRPIPNGKEQKDFVAALQ